MSQYVVIISCVYNVHRNDTRIKTHLISSIIAIYMMFFACKSIIMLTFCAFMCVICTCVCVSCEFLFAKLKGYSYFSLSEASFWHLCEYIKKLSIPHQILRVEKLSTVFLKINALCLLYFNLLLGHLLFTIFKVELRCLIKHSICMVQSK